MNINKLLRDLEHKIENRAEEVPINFANVNIKEKINNFRSYVEKTYGIKSIINLSNLMILAIIKAVDSESRDNFGIADEEIVYEEYEHGNVEILNGSSNYNIFVKWQSIMNDDSSMVMVLLPDYKIIHLTKDEIQDFKDITGR